MLGGDILGGVIIFLKVSAGLNHIAAWGHVAARIDGDAVCLIVEILFQFYQDRQVLRPVMSKVLLVFNLRVKFKAIHIVRLIDNIRHTGGMRTDGMPSRFSDRPTG